LSNKQVSLADILNAEKRIRKYVRETPLEYSRYLSRITEEKFI